MYDMEGDGLTVRVLDPVTDQARLGSRYCTGGYIHQVIDSGAGPLFTGPQWDRELPDPFHGQGAPEAFALYPGADDAAIGALVGVVGVGAVRRTSAETPFQPRHNPEVVEFAAWHVTRRAGAVAMTTEQAPGPWRYRLDRTVSVAGRTVRSETTLGNLGGPDLPFRWFAHPFFPTPDGERLFRANLPLAVPGSPGFSRDADGWFCRKPAFDWAAGCFADLAYDPAEGRPLDLVQRHPRVGEIAVRTDFVPTRFPIWGNDRTFSVEPYFGGILAPGQSASWAIWYVIP